MARAYVFVWCVRMIFVFRILRVPAYYRIVYSYKVSSHSTRECFFAGARVEGVCVRSAINYALECIHAPIKYLSRAHVRK